MNRMLKKDGEDAQKSEQYMKLKSLHSLLQDDKKRYVRWSQHACTVMVTVLGLCVNRDSPSGASGNVMLFQCLKYRHLTDFQVSPTEVYLGLGLIVTLHVCMYYILCVCVGL